MINEKKTLGKKRKKNDSNEIEDNKNEINDESDINKKNNMNSQNKFESMNNDSVKNNTINNSILITKKDNTNNNNSSSLYTFNNTSYVKGLETNENEKNNQNNISNTNKNNNNSIIAPKKKNTNSDYSDNSEDSHSSNPQKNERGTQSKIPKFKSHSQNSRNTAFGLKEISKRVMEIIKQSGQTTYKAISDQIVNEINEKSIKDEKNIRRRIYDSLNVMKSMNLFHRDKNSKTIMWNYDQEFDPLNEIENKNEKDEKNKECKFDSWNIIEKKKTHKEKKEKCNLLNRELKGLKNVLERNNREDETVPENNKLYFPFIVIEFQSNKDPKINVALNENQTKAHFGFDEADAMYGDLDMVSKIGNHPNFSK